MYEERSYESMTEQEKQTRFAAICHWVGTSLTHSVYVLYCNTPEEAEKKAYGFFFAKKGQLFKDIQRIEILPQGKGVHDAVTPVFIKEYIKQK